MEHLRQPAQFLGKFKESIKCRRDTKKFMRHGEKLRLNRHQPGRPADFLKKNHQLHRRQTLSGKLIREKH